MNLLDLLFPKNCLECKRSGKYICSSCLAKVEPAKLVCPVCKKHNFSGKTHSFCINKFLLNRMHSFWFYEGVVRKAILALKYRFAYDIAQELVHSLNPNLGIKNAVLVPVPLHKHRENWRGFNQAAVLGKLLAEKMNWQFNDKLLLRLDDTVPQVVLGKKERLQNIRGKFAFNAKHRSSFANHKLLIIFDDVWTTGATVAEAARALKKAGAKEVWGMSVAKSL